jgi:hypothetical protein
MNGASATDVSHSGRGRMLRDWASTLWGDDVGVVALAHGRLRLAAKGKSKVTDFRQEFFEWPSDAERLVDRALLHAAQAEDVWVAPMLRDSRDRLKTNGVGGCWAWVDCDGEWTQQRQAMLDRLGDTMLVCSGRGHHAYVRLAERVEALGIEPVNKALRTLLDGDNKWSNESLLRPPGTFNQKPVVESRLAPAPTFIKHRTPGVALRAETICAMAMTVNPPGAGGPVHAARLPTGTQPSGDASSRVATLAQAFGGDRSLQMHMVVARCVREGMSDHAIHQLVADFGPAVEKYGDRLHDEIDRSIGKVRAEGGTAYAVPIATAGADELESLTTATNLPQEFWLARESLTHIRDAAYSRGAAADAVLGVVLAREAALIPPAVGLPAIRFGRASLNMLVASIGSSGTGKSGAEAVGEELIPIDVDDVLVVGAGSGEGMIEAYFETRKETVDGHTATVKRQTRRGVLFHTDEGQALLELGNRSGSTLLPTMRAAWSGRLLGQANAAKDTNRLLKPHTYRLSLLVGFQLEHAVPLLNDAPAGTPQRFLFVSATDPNIPDDRVPAWPGPLELDLPQREDIIVCDEVAGLIRREGLAVSRGELTLEALDAHANLLRLKVAALLAVLDHRRDVNSDDWLLAGMVMDASRAVRNRIGLVARYQAHQREGETNARLARREISIEETKEQRALLSMAKSMARRAGRDGTPVSRTELSKAAAGPHRKLVGVDDAIAYAISQRWIVAEGDEYRAGPSRPA